MYFLNNFIIDLFLLAISGMCFKRIFKIRNLIIASVLGGLYSTIVLLNIYPFFNSVIFKTIVSSLMIIISFKLTFKEFLKQLSCFYLSSFVLAGIITAFSSANGESVMFFYNSLYFKIPFFNFVLSGITMSIFISKTFRQVIKKHTLSSIYRKVTIINGKKKMKITGYVDTGNNLTYSGFPVCIISPSVFKKLNATYEFQIPCFTVNGFDYLKAFKADNVSFDEETVNVLLAVSKSVSGEDYDILINSEFLIKGRETKNDIPMAYK